MGKEEHNEKERIKTYEEQLEEERKSGFPAQHIVDFAKKLYQGVEPTPEQKVEIFDKVMEDKKINPKDRQWLGAYIRESYKNT